MRIGVDALFENIRTGAGGLTYLRQMIRHLAMLSEGGDGDQYFVFTAPDSSESYRFPGVTPVPCGAMSERTPGRLLAQQLTIPRKARKLGLSCLLCPGNTASILSGVPMVVVIQNRLQFDLPPAYGWGRRIFRQVVSRLSVRRAALVVTVSWEMADYLVRSIGIPQDKVRVVYNGIDWAPPPSGKKRPSPVPFPYVLNVSTLLDHKNHETLLRAFALLVREDAFARHRLVIVGRDWGGRKARLQRLAGELGIPDSVVFPGHLVRDDLPAYYQNASVFVLPSLVESFGLPILEAMSQGAPVVASDRTAIPEIVGNAGLTVDATDPEKMASAIRRVVNDQELRETLIRRGFERVLSFDWKTSAREMSRILSEAAGRGRR